MFEVLRKIIVIWALIIFLEKLLDMSKSLDETFGLFLQGQKINTCLILNVHYFFTVTFHFAKYVIDCMFMKL